MGRLPELRGDAAGPSRRGAQPHRRQARRGAAGSSAEGGDEDQPDGQIAAEAVRLLEDAFATGPFFLAVGFHKPHDPFTLPKKYFDLLSARDDPLAHEPDDRSVDLPLALPNPKTFAAFTDQERREFRRAYYAGTSFTDAQVGKLLDTLDRLTSGRARSWSCSAIMATTWASTAGGTRSPSSSSCARAPLIVWAPDATRMGRSTRAIVEFVDLYPTIAAPLRPDRAGQPRRIELPAGPRRPGLPGKPAAFTQVVRGPGDGPQRPDRPLALYRMERGRAWGRALRPFQRPRRISQPRRPSRMAVGRGGTADPASSRQALTRNPDVAKPRALFVALVILSAWLLGLPNLASPAHGDETPKKGA